MSAPGVRDRLRGIQARGGRVVVVEPRRTETARVADEHIFIRPGTDALMLAAMVREALAAGPRLGHLGPVCDGLDRLREAVAPFTPEDVAEATGVGADTMRRLATELRDRERAVVYGRLGTCTQAFGALSQWLVNALNAVTGHLDREGGAMLTEPAVDAVRAPAAFGVGRGSYGRWRSRVRGLPEFGGELPVAALAEDMDTPGDGRIRALLTLAGNPVLSTPNGRRLERALPVLDAMIAVDLYVNETTRHAHLILPPVSPLERPHYDVALHLLAVRNTARYSPPLFEPPAGARADWQIMSELEGRLLALRHGRLGRRYLEHRALHALGPERLLDAGLRVGPYGRGLAPFGLPIGPRGHRPGAEGLSLPALRRAPHGLDLGPLRPCLADRLPEGRIDLSPLPLVEDLPRLRERMRPQAAGSLLLIGRRHVRSNNSWCHNVPHLMRGRSRCTLMMSPADAERLGLADGQPVSLRSRVGEVTVELQVSADMMPGVVSLPHGFGHDRPGVLLRVAREHPGASVNDVTDDQAVDPLSGTAAFSGVPVQVTAAGAADASPS